MDGNKDKEKRDSGARDPDIEVDHDNIDVAKIMDQIKRKAADEARRQSEVSPRAAGGDRTAPEHGLGDEFVPPGRGGKARKILLKIMTPFRPLIKLLILPVYEEQRQTVRILHQTNQRLDHLYGIHDREHGLIFQRLDRLREYTKLLHLLSHNIVVELSKLKIEEETLKTTARLLEKDFEHLGQRERALEREVFK
jgi:hypothetical protein